MKRVKAAFLLLFATILLMLLLTNRMQTIGKALTTQTAAVERAFQSADFYRAETEFEALFSTWQQAQATAISLAGRNHTDEINIALMRTKSALQSKDAPTGLAELAELTLQITRMCETERFDLLNLS